MLRSAPLEIIPFAAAGLPLAQNWPEALKEADPKAERAVLATHCTCRLLPGTAVVSAR